MRPTRIWALVAALAIVGSACGGGSEEADEPVSSITAAPTAAPASTVAPTTAPPTTAPIPEGGTAIQGLHVSRVVFGADGFVEIGNTSDSDISLDGLWLCQFPNYLALSGTVAAGDSVQVSALEVGGLSADAGEAAIYSERKFDSPDAIIDYVGWGSGGPRGEVAALAGIWPEGVNVSAPPDFIELGGAPGDPEAWG